MRMKASLGILLVASLTMCSMQSASLEARYIQNLRVRETHGSTGTTLHVSGLCGHSSYVITKVETTKRGNAAILDIKISPAKDALLQKGFTGNLSCAVTLPEDTEKVLLGSNRTEIWPHYDAGAKPD